MSAIDVGWISTCFVWLLLLWVLLMGSGRLRFKEGGWREWHKSMFKSSMSATGVSFVSLAFAKPRLLRSAASCVHLELSWGCDANFLGDVLSILLLSSYSFCIWPDRKRRSH